jgi:hypothetical protein
MSRHIIHTQKITLNLPKREEAYAIQNRVSALLRDELIIGMETVFDELFPAGDIIRIDSLKLDLGNIDSRNFEQEFKEQFIQELRKNLSSKKGTLSHSDNEEILSKTQSQIRALIYFLEYGYLPWYCSVENIADWEEEIITCFSRKKELYFFTWLGHNYKNNPVVLQRLILQFTDRFLEGLLTITSPLTDASWSLVCSDLNTVINSCKTEGLEARTTIWKYIFHSLMDQPGFGNNNALSVTQENELVFRVLKLLAEHFKISKTDITASVGRQINKQLKTSIVENAFREFKLLLMTQNDEFDQKVRDQAMDAPVNIETGQPRKSDDTNIAVDQEDKKSHKSDDINTVVDQEDKKSRKSDDTNTAVDQEDKKSTLTDMTKRIEGHEDNKSNGLYKADADHIVDSRNGKDINPNDPIDNSYQNDQQGDMVINQPVIDDDNKSLNTRAKRNEKISEDAENTPELVDQATGASRNKNDNKLSRDVTAGNEKDHNISGQQSLYIKSSGIVILHYFLKPFFEGLNLLSEGQFKDDTAHQRAVLLLHYLATGDTEVAEFDLTLHKILCGYSLSETLPTAIILSKKEKIESKKLLEAVIDHWTPMKNTSVEGLRDAFLQRDGKLTTKENGWLLTVEQRTLDLLLGKLPWGFSTIRLPWMEQILNVDWY